MNAPQSTAKRVGEADCLTTAWFTAVYGVLIVHAGVPVGGRQNFVYDHTKDQPCNEYWLTGKFASGVYCSKTNRVACHLKDITPERSQSLERVNAALKALEPVQASVTLDSRGALLKLITDHRRLVDSIITWRDMPADEMRLRAGEMTADEIRSVRAILKCIWPDGPFQRHAGSAEPVTYTIAPEK